MQKNIIMGVVLAVAFGAGLWVSLGQRSVPMVEGMLPVAKVIAPFSLKDSAGEVFDLERLKGKWSVISIGYTSCPDICPNTLYKYQKIKKFLEKARPEMVEKTQFVFVSVDPHRDTEEKLSEYMAFFDPMFVGVTGTNGNLEDFTREVYAAFEVPDTSKKGYDVVHSVSLHVISPEGKMVGVITAPYTAEEAWGKLDYFMESL